jgi:hypothetical protein
MPRVPFDPATDYYHLLGVGVAASPEEIQAAYRRLAKEYHPDLHAGSAVAEGRMARLNVAKSVLLDRETRASYDQLRAARWRPAPRVVRPGPPAPPPPQTRPTSTVRYAPDSQAGVRPRHRVASVNFGGSSRGNLDRQTGVLLIVALPLIAALVLYVFQAVQVSVQPLRAGPADLNLAQAPAVRPTAKGAADAVFAMVHAQPPSRELAVRANNLILSRSDSSPESELLRADGRQLLRAGAAGDRVGWEATVNDVCHLAGRCQ